jgi:hypothetical protein
MQTAQGVYPSTSTPLYWHRMREFNFSPVQLENVFDPEVGGTLLPSGAYKAGYWVGGDGDTFPRLDHAIGYLFRSFAGGVTSTGLAGQSATKAMMHVFPGRPDNQIPDVWMTFRRIINGLHGDTMGEEYRDNRVLSLTLTGAPGAPFGMRFGIQGLDVAYNPAPAGAGWAPNTDNGGYEDYPGVPLATKGTIDLHTGQKATNIQNVQITLAAGGMNPQQEMVIGSYHPTGITTLARNVTIQASMFYTDKTMYNNLYYNGGSSWSPVVWSSPNPFVVEFETPDNIYGTPKVAGKVGFWAPKMMWRMDPIGLRGGDVISCRLTGVVLDNGAQDSWRLYLVNQHQDYTTP